MQAPALDVVQDGSVMHITLNRPDKRNALTRAMLDELLAVLRGLPAEVRLVVLAAKGAVFCAGMDLQEMQDTAALADAGAVWRGDADRFRQVLETLFFLPCPTLCVVQGPVLAGGLGLALACDLVLATESASFALPEPKRGIVAAMVLPLAVLRMGYGPASWLLLSGQTVHLEEARRFGIVHETTTSATIDHDLPAAIAAILTGAPGALAAAKRQLQQPIAQELRSGWDTAAVVSAAARSEPEAREGLQAFLERRTPHWVPVQG